MTSSSSIDPLYNERQALSILYQQPHILDIHDISTSVHIHGHTYFAVVMELAGQGDMLEYVQTKAFSEPLARTYFRQLLTALRTSHMAGIYHRDVKLENLLLANDFGLKLADFGLCYMMPSYANERNGEPFISGVCGSPGYVAPEVCSQGHYLGSTADVWSAGCVLFAMLAGHSAFEMSIDPKDSGSSYQDEWLAMIMRGDYSSFWRCHFSGGIPLSPLVVDLLNKIFTADPYQRLSVDEALAHPWMTTGSDLGPKDLFTEMDGRRCNFEISHADSPTRLSEDEFDENGTTEGADDDLEDPLLCTLAEALEPFAFDDDHDSSTVGVPPNVSFISIVATHNGASASDLIQTPFNESHPSPHVVTPRDEDKTMGMRLTSPSPKTFLSDSYRSSLFSETSPVHILSNATPPNLMLTISDASAFTQLPCPSSPRPMVSPRSMVLSPEPCASPKSVMNASQFSGKEYMEMRPVHENFKVCMESPHPFAAITSTNKRGSYTQALVDSSCSMENHGDGHSIEPPTKRRMSDVADELTSYYFTSP